MEQEYSSQQQYRQSLPGPTTPLQMSPIIRKRPPGSSLERPPFSAPRLIQPKPHPEPGRYPVSEVRTGVPIPRAPEPPRGDTPRKRGRPSKVEMQRRRMAEEARSQSHPARPNNTTPRPGYGAGILPAAPPGVQQSPYSPAMGQRQPPEQMRELDPPTPMSVQYHGSNTPPSQTQDIQVQQRVPRPQPLQPRVEGGAMLQESPMIIESKEASREAPATAPDIRMSPTATSASGNGHGNGQRPEGITTPAPAAPASTKPESPASRERASPVQTVSSMEEDKGS
ncbi:hypothetical protein FQN49_000481 [Arthroderma sp. PD_2]|nr:hypothetical protein FQN49_000481 [Arthroderma sp. PD_2]